MDEETFNKAKQYAYKRLAMKSEPSGELLKAIEKKGYDTEIGLRIVSELQAMGYVNDENWIENYIESQAIRKKSPQAIKQKLRLKGVFNDQAKSLLQEYPQKECIQKLLESKYKKRDLTNYKEKQKVIASLYRKGFSIESIEQALRQDS